MNNFQNGATLFVVSHQVDANAMTEVLSRLDNEEAENKSAEEQTKIVLQRLKHKRDALALDTSDEMIWNKDYSLNRNKLPEMLNTLNERIKKNYPNTVVTALVGLDRAEEDLSKDLVTYLRSQGLKAKTIDLCFGYSTVAKAIEKSKAYPQKLHRIYMDPKTRLQKFLDWISHDHASDLDTGFPDLDKALGGGLFSGLYVLGAPSSIGKSTLALQIADHLAEKEHTVLYYSLEMDDKHITAKSINRMAFQQMGDFYPTKNTPTAMKLYQGKWLDQFDKDMYSNLMLAYQRYADISLHMIPWNEEDRLPTAQRIYDDVEDFCVRTGETPVVIIDYLQLLRSPDGKENQTDKQRVSDAIWKLKTISRDFDVPVIAISSFNRANYNDPLADMSALKESGEIDYSAETIITLGYDLEHTRINNLDGLNEKWKKKNISEWLNKEREATMKEAITHWKKQPERAVTVRFLKNRYGAISNDITLYTYPKYDLFFNATKDGEPDEQGIYIDLDTVKAGSRVKDGELIYDEDAQKLLEMNLDLPF